MTSLLQECPFGNLGHSLHKEDVIADEFKATGFYNWIYLSIYMIYLSRAIYVCLYIFMSLWWERASFNLGWPLSSCGAEHDLELVIPLPLTPRCLQWQACDAGLQTQSLVCAKQALNWLSYILVPQTYFWGKARLQHSWAAVWTRDNRPGKEKWRL